MMRLDSGSLGQNGLGVWLGVLLFCAGLPAQEQGEKQRDSFRFTPSPEIPIPAEDEHATRLPLRLEDALRMGQVQSVDLRALELGPAKALHDLQVAKAFFEPEVFSSVKFTQGEDPQRNAFSPEIKREFYDVALGWRQRVVTGGIFDVSLTTQKLRQTTTTPNFPNRQFDTGYLITYTQPLLRNAWTGYSLRDVDTARASQGVATHSYQEQVQGTLLAIVRAYWELIFAREDYRVQFQGLELANEQLRITNAKIEAKSLAPRDAVADEAEVARRKEILINALRSIRDREDDLRRLLFDNRDGKMWQRPLQPISPIETDYDHADIHWQTMARIARRHRPELNSLRAEISIAEVALMASNIELLPQLDLVGSYNTSGVRDNSAGAWQDAIDLNFPDWSVGLEFSIPIGNSAAKARRAKAHLEMEERKRNLYAQELDVDKEVREAVRNLSTLAESIRAAQESVRLALSDLDTARRKERVGELTMFDVQERNQQLVEARSRLLRNQLDYRIAQVVLLHVQGTLDVKDGRLP